MNWYHDVWLAQQRPVDPEPARRKAICQDCTDRPAGCWKAVEYDCQTKYRAAERQATEIGFCPLNKWHPKQFTANTQEGPVGDSRTIICCLSTPQYTQRLAACESTWMNDARAMGQRVVVVQSGKLESYGSRVWLDLPDTYETLPQKTRGLCLWALTRDDWDYLFKCDDDTYVSIPRFMKYDPAGRDYIGGYCGSGGELYAHGGAGYFLSRAAARVIADHMTEETGGEDYHVGRTLRLNGIGPNWDNAFVGNGSMARRTRFHNNIITCHTKSASVFYACHAEAGMGGADVGVPDEPTDQRVRRIRGIRQRMVAAQR